MQINPSLSLNTVGGKAYQLFKLKEYCNVPDFFVISFNDPSEIDDPFVHKTIIEYSDCKNYGLMAVRSSANIEDSSDASFAGMFLTLLGVRTNTLIQSIKSVLESIKSERVKSYSEAHGYDINKIRMAVIIQKIVRSCVSGVCFTRFNENRDQMIIEACYGLGELLVSGSINPDKYIINRNTLLLEEETIGYQAISLEVSPNGTNIDRVEIPFHKRNARKLDFERLREVSKKCLSIEKYASFDPADIEWSFGGNKLFILQTRPCTIFSVDSKVTHKGEIFHD